MTMNKLALTTLAATAMSLAALGVPTGTAFAGQGHGDTMAATFAADGEISAYEAKKLALRHLHELGYTKPGMSQMTAKLIDVQNAGGDWEITVRLGNHLPIQSGVLVIDGRSGEVSKSLL